MGGNERNINNDNIFFQISFLGLLHHDREGWSGGEGKVTSRLHFPAFCGGERRKSKFQVHIPEGKKILLFPFLGSHLFFAGGAKKTQGMTLWFLQNREQGSISILGKRLLTRNKNRLCSKTCGVDEKQNLAGGINYFSRN